MNVPRFWFLSDDKNKEFHTICSRFVSNLELKKEGSIFDLITSVDESLKNHKFSSESSKDQFMELYWGFLLACCRTYDLSLDSLLEQYKLLGKKIVLIK